jgi:hypothetical protein
MSFFCLNHIVRSLADPTVEGIKYVLNCISSTSHSNDVLVNLVNSVMNFSSENLMCAQLVVQNRALEFLQPLVVNDDPIVALLACGCICTLAAEKKFSELVDRCQVLPFVQDVLRSIAPGSLQVMSTWNAQSKQNVVNMMNGDAHPAVQLCALHMIGITFHIEQNLSDFSTVKMLNLFRNIASSPDPFVYAAAVYLMRMLRLPVPYYRAIKIEGSKDVIEWSVEKVCKWVRASSS